jgi:hypothetical protein
MTQTIWYQDLRDFFAYDNLLNFFPSLKMTETARLNALFRFSLYLSILFFLYNKNEKVFLIPFITGIYTFYIFNKLEKNKFENFDNLYNKQIIRNPTQENPFMNPNLLTERNPDAQADNIFKRKTQNEIKKFFEINSIADASDVYDRNSAYNRFYTTPSTTIPNKQDKFANFLYGSMKSRKEMH